MPKGRKSWIHKANKNRKTNFDSHKLDNIQSHSPLKWIREETILDSNFTTLYATRIPDLICKGKTPVILEHDTVKIHGELAFENERTINRNKDYARSKRPFFVINEDLAKELKLDEVALSTYLYYHTLSQFEALNNI